jgi:hypothetical protein
MFVYIGLLYKGTERKNENYPLPLSQKEVKVNKYERNRCSHWWW